MNKVRNHSHDAGFVALITAIALSSILILVAITLNQSGFFTRQGLLESEYKERSVALAEACVDTALLHLATDISYAGNETITIGTDSCQIRPVKVGVPSAGQNTIETRAVWRQATTNLRIVINSINLSIISWDEVAAF